MITESPIDAEVIKHLLKEGGADPIKFSVSVLALDGVKSLPYAYHLLEALDLSFATVVDKDYFMPYSEDELEKSRDGNGFPKYKHNYCPGTLLEDMVPSLLKRNNLLRLLHSNHSQAMDILEEANVFCFRWSMDIDLVASESAVQLLYASFNLPLARQNKKEILINNRKSLKKLDRVLPVVQSLRPMSLPNSYKRIRKNMAELVRQAAIR